jgi:hypothetical protein
MQWSGCQETASFGDAGVTIHGRPRSCHGSRGSCSARRRARGQDEDCLECHAETDIKSSEGRGLFGDPALFSRSPHAGSGRACATCHAGTQGKPAKLAPHPVPLLAASADCHPAQRKRSRGASIKRQEPVAVQRKRARARERQGLLWMSRPARSVPFCSLRGVERQAL